MFWGALFVGFAAALLLAEFVLIEPLGASGLLLPLVGWGLAVAWAGHRWQSLICPRCGHRYFRRSPPLLPIHAKRCVYCLLSKD